jgi:hypothetical protein
MLSEGAERTFFFDFSCETGLAIAGEVKAAVVNPIVAFLIKSRRLIAIEDNFQVNNS